MVPAGPVREKLALLRERLTNNEVSRLTGVSRYQLESMLRPNRRTVRASEAEAILAASPETGWLRICDLPRFSGPKFRRVREKAGYSMASLEAAGGLGTGLVRHWEDERHKPRLERLERAMSILGCTFEDVSGPCEEEFEPEIPHEVAAKFSMHQDQIASGYPCHVCGEIFRSRRALASHPHDRKKEKV